MDQNEIYAAAQPTSGPAAYGYSAYPNFSGYGIRQAYPDYGGYWYASDAAGDPVSGMDPATFRQPFFFGGRRPFFFGFPFGRPFFSPFFSPFFNPFFSPFFFL